MECEGTLKAIRHIRDTQTADRLQHVMAAMDELGWRGRDIWIAYKFCNQSADMFCDKVESRDTQLVRHVMDTCQWQSGWAQMWAINEPGARL